METGSASVRIERLTYSDSKTFAPVSDYFLVLVEEGRLDYSNVSLHGTLSRNEVIASRRGCGLVFRLEPDTRVLSLDIQGSLIDRIIPYRTELDFIRTFFADSRSADQGGGFKLYRIRDSVSRIRAFCEEAIEERKNQNQFSDYMIQAKITELIILIHRASADKDEPGFTRAGHPQGIDGVIEHIEANYTEEFSLAELASRLGLTPAYFSRLFHATAGMPLFEYINTIRIRKACMLLKRTEMSVLEIAYAVGYNNLSFFNRYFRKIMNTSPREYKRQK